MEDNGSVLPEALTEIMKSPEMEAVLSALGAGGQKSEDKKESLALPPDFMEKLPAVLSALSGLGMGMPGASVPQKPSGGAVDRRKNLLRALRPYLNPKRRSVVDSLISLDSLSGLLSNSGKGEK